MEWKPAVVSVVCMLLSMAGFKPGYGVAGDVPRGVRLGRVFPHDGRDRSCLIHVPLSYREGQPVPLVFVFHGGTGTAKMIAQFTGFDELSQRHGFIVVYPQGLNGHWNDGRKEEEFREHNESVDDVGFIIALLESLKAEFAVDPNAVFATGVSNGGMFSHRLGIEHSQQFAAIAPMIGGIPEPIADGKPQQPVSVLLMNGTEDPFVPYGGGPITVRLFPLLRRRRLPDRGRVISTDAAVQFWLRHNGIAAEPRTTKLADTDPNDGCRVERTEWSDAERRVSVVLYKIIGGGHTYPGGSQYLPERVIGRTCGDFQATEAIWAFFAAHRR